MRQIKISYILNFLLLFFFRKIFISIATMLMLFFFFFFRKNLISVSGLFSSFFLSLFRKTVISFMCFFLKPFFFDNIYSLFLYIQKKLYYINYISIFQIFFIKIFFIRIFLARIFSTRIRRNFYIVNNRKFYIVFFSLTTYLHSSKSN